MISQQEYDNLYSVAERALHVDKIAYEVSSYLALPQLAAFSMAARDFQDTDRARLAAPTAYERLWATGQAGGVAPQLRWRLPKIFRFCRDVSSEPRPLFEALFRRVRWHGGPMEQVRWSYEAEPDLGPDADDKDVGNFALRLRPRFSCGAIAHDAVHGDDFNDSRVDVSYEAVARTNVLLAVEFATLDKAPGLTFVLETGKVKLRETNTAGESGFEFRTTLSVSADGGEYKELCFISELVIRLLGEAQRQGFRATAAEGTPLHTEDFADDYDPTNVELWGAFVHDKNVDAFARRLPRGDPLLRCRMKDVFVSFCCYATMAWVSSDYRDHLGRDGAGVDPWRDGDYVRLKWGRRNEYYPDTPDESDSDADY